MCRSKIGQLTFKEIKKDPKAEKDHEDWEKLEAKLSPRVMTREQKIQEASKPLYLRRYE